MESNNKVMDNLKTSVDAKMMVFEDQIAVTQSKLENKISVIQNEFNDKIKSSGSSMQPDKQPTPSFPYTTAPRIS